jgi:uncharacterized protein YbjT (DUF2867 family)
MKNQNNNQIQNESTSPTIKRTVLVTGATGQQGGAVARLLNRRGHTVRGLTRNPDSAASATLRNLGIEMIKGNLDDTHSVEKAARGADAAFIMATPFKEEGNIERETNEAIKAIDAVINAGVKHLIYSSVAGADKNTGIPHFDSKYKVEQYIRQNVKIPFTIVAPVFFMENFLIPQVSASISQGKLAMPLSSSRQLQQVALDDLAGVVVQALELPESFSGKRIEVASDEVTLPEVAKVLTEVINRKVDYSEFPLQAVRPIIGEDQATMFEWLNNQGFTADISGLRSTYPEISWHSFRDWAKRQNWKAAAVQ